MHVDDVDLRERMRSRPTEDLRQIIRNARDDYTPAAVQAAQDEVAARKGVADVIADSFRRSSSGESLRSILPGGLWLVFCLASGKAAIEVVSICVALVLVLAHAITLDELLPTLGSTSGTAAVAVFIAASIRAERSYVQVLLLSLIVATIVYRVAFAVVEQSFTLDAIEALGPYIVALWYFASSDSVSRYYRVLRASGGDGLSPQPHSAA